jgi:diguanylate cyclase (GGDEF)-like protein/PAS domain S-box-containing protein
MKILLVEDSRVVAMAMSAKLKKFGHEVVLAENGQIAIDLFIQAVPELILMDINMPVMNGFEATSHVRAYETAHELVWTPILILTASDTLDNLVNAIDAGADDFIAKSAPESVLHAKIKAMTRIAEKNKEILFSRAKYQNLFDHMSNGFALHEMIFDAQGNPVDYRFIEVNPAYEKMTGFSKENLVGRTVLEVMPKTENCWIKNFGEVVTNGEPRTFANFSIQLGRWYKVVAYRPESGKFAVTVEDITDRKLAEDALAESEQRFREAFESAAHGLALVSTEGRFIKVNAALCSILGYDEAELLASNLKTITHPDDYLIDSNNLSDLLQNRIESYQIEKRCIHKTGSIVWVLLNKSLIRTTEGKPVHFVSQIQNISQSKLDQQRLHQLMVEQKAMLENELVGIAKVNNRTITWANPALEKILGYSSGELVGMHTRECYPNAESYLSIGTSAYPDLLSNNIFRTQIELACRDGKLIWVDISGSTLDAESGDSLWTFLDIGDQKRVEEERIKFQEIEKFFHSIDQQVLKGAHIVDIFQHICEGVTRVFDLQYAWIGRKDAGGIVSICAGAGPSAKYHDELDQIGVRWDDTPLGNGGTGTTIRSGKILGVFKLSNAGFRPWVEAAKRNNIASSLSLPLIIKGEVYGAFTLCSRVEDDFDQPDILQRLSIIVSRICIALETASDQQQLMLLGSALSTTGHGVYITDKTGKIQWINKAFTTLTGYTGAEVVGLTPRILNSGKQDAAFYENLWKTILRGEAWHGEMENRQESGRTIFVRQTITPILDQGNITHFIAILEDISSERAAEACIEHMAHYDSLTNLPNRALFLDLLRQVLQLAKRDKRAVALMFLDLDRFKSVNDTLGHHAGDLLLQQVATRLKECVRDSDTVARLGGDEFTVLLPEITERGDAANVAEKIIAAFDSPFDLDGHAVHSSTSVGIAIFPKDASDEEEILKRADEAMYKAKESGRNRFSFFEPH